MKNALLFYYSCSAVTGASDIGYVSCFGWPCGIAASVVLGQWGLAKTATDNGFTAEDIYAEDKAIYERTHAVKGATDAR